MKGSRSRVQPTVVVPYFMLRCLQFVRRSAFIIASVAVLCTLRMPASAAAQARPAAPTRSEPAPAVDLEEVDQATRAHLERAQQFLLARQWSEAVQTLRQVMEGDSDRLILITDPADAPIARYIRLREYGHLLLCRWSVTAPEALAEYRREVDPLAERWLAEASQQREPALFARIVEQFFASSVGDQALLLLGEYALERGDYTQARRWWESISPQLRITAPSSAGAPASGRPLWLSLRGRREVPAVVDPSLLAGSEAHATTWLAYPDSDVPLADLRARLTLVSILEGSHDRARIEWQLLREFHPDARGTIGGREGNYVELLEQMLEQSATWPRSPASSALTFAGSVQRNPVVRERMDVGGAPLWRVRLPGVSAEQDLVGAGGLRVGEDAHAALSYYPLIVGRRVLLSSGSAVYAWDLQTGEPAFGQVAPTYIDGNSIDSQPLAAPLYEIPQRQPSLPATEAPQLGTRRFTLSAAEGRVFATLGSPVTRWPNLTDFLSVPRAQVVGLDLDAEGRLLHGFPLELESGAWAFDGTPIVDGQRLYVALRRQDDVRVEAHVACYDALSGRLLWRRRVCTADTAGQGRARENTHNLLSLDGSTVYFNTNLGVIAALERETGRPRWIVEYPRTVFPFDNPADAGLHYFRDLTPALVDRGVIYVAPADCDRLLALDAIHGQLLWSTRAGYAADARHLLGVAGDYLLVSGEALYWIDRLDGRPVTQFPAERELRRGFSWSEPRGYGRGLLGPDEVYWPTRTAIYVFRIQPQAGQGGWTPVFARGPMELAAHGLPSGNLVAGENVLLIASTHELVALRYW